ncbi:uncharacterized protein WM277_023155 isoform 1-T4 [Molossus nigricans]
MRCARRRSPQGWGGARPRAPRPAPRAGRPAEGGRGAREAQCGSARGAGALRARRSPASPRVQVHRRGQSPRPWGRVLPLPAPSRDFHVPRCSGDPTPPPSRPRRATGLECEPRRTGGTGTRVALLLRPGPDSGRAPAKPNVEAPPGKEVRLPPRATPSGSWNRQEIARGRSGRFCRQPPSLKGASPTRLASPPPPAPRRSLCVRTI